MLTFASGGKKEKGNAILLYVMEKPNYYLKKLDFYAILEYCAITEKDLYLQVSLQVILFVNSYYYLSSLLSLLY